MNPTPPSLEPHQTDLRDYRYERKFLCHGNTAGEVVSLLRCNPAHFREIYRERTVNNIYFDTPFLDLYHANIDGNRRRYKIRLRWYGPMENIESGRLEFKFKDGLAGSKDGYPIKVDSWKRLLAHQSPQYQEIDIPMKALQLWKQTRPVLMNRYQRRYFLSSEGECRATIDHQMRFFRVSGSLSDLGDGHNHLRDLVILELKYNTDIGNKIEYITSNLPYRLSRFSKYIVGVNSVWML